MIVIQFRQNFFHNGFAEQSGLRPYTEFVTILLYGSYLTVIQIDDLSVSANKGLLLLFDIFGIDSRLAYFFLTCHCG